MRKVSRMAGGMVMVGSLLALTANAYAADAQKKAPTDKQMIASAMSAAPVK